MIEVSRRVYSKLQLFQDLLCVQQENDKCGDSNYSNNDDRYTEETTRSDRDDPARNHPQRANFEAPPAPSQMRCLALVSHNQMKASMKKFVLANKDILKKFRLTGTNSTMTMLREVFLGDDSIVFGPSCKSGPLGGDAELVALMCTGQLGGVIFFQDPMTSHPHQSDIECLCRQALVHNTMIAHNPTSALMMMTTLRVALRENRPELIPSFFLSLQSPSVEVYKEEQRKVVASHSETAFPPANDLIVVKEKDGTLDITDHTQSTTSSSDNSENQEIADIVGEDHVGTPVQLVSCTASVVAKGANLLEPAAAAAGGPSTVVLDDQHSNIHSYKSHYLGCSPPPPPPIMKEDSSNVAEDLRDTPPRVNDHRHLYGKNRSYHHDHDHEEQEDSSSVVSSATTASRLRRVEAQEQLMASFANFVNSLNSSTTREARAGSRGGSHKESHGSHSHHRSARPAHSLSKSNHSYFEKAARRRLRPLSSTINNASTTTANILSNAESRIVTRKNKNHTSNRSYLNDTATSAKRRTNNVARRR